MLKNVENMPECSPTRRIRVCMVALSAYSLVSQNARTSHGGAEVQQFLMARWLRDNGHDVVFITYDHGQSTHQEANGFSVIRAYKRESGLPILRFFHPRWTGLWRALKRADADIYYQRGAGVETGQVALWCRLFGRRFVFGTANDRDLLVDLPYLPNLRAKVLFRMGLRLSQHVVCQSETQKQLLTRNFGKHSTIIRNIGAEHSGKLASYANARNVLWVGRFIQLKRLELLLDVAERLPSFQFNVVGEGNLQDEYVRELIKRAERLKNVTLHGSVPYSKMHEHYSSAGVLCSTSEHEGFPNVYVEAWSASLPVLTSFDPDGIVRSSGAGWVATTAGEFVKTLQEIEKDPHYWELASQNARTQFDTCHAADPNMNIFLMLVGEDTAANPE